MTDRTTVMINQETLERLKDAKPYQSVSYDEMLNEMLDQYKPKVEQ